MWSNRKPPKGTINIDSAVYGAADEAKRLAIALVDTVRKEGKVVHENNRSSFIAYAEEYAKRCAYQELGLDPARVDIESYKENTYLQGEGLKTKIQLMGMDFSADMRPEAFSKTLDAVFDAADPDFGSRPEHAETFMVDLHRAIRKEIKDASSNRGRG